MSTKTIGCVILVIGMVTWLGYAGMSWAADESKNQTKLKIASTAQPGGGIKSTKASGADKVAKSKVCSAVAPKIKNVNPDQGKTGDKITITGDNFGDVGCLSMVAFGPGNPSKFTHVNGNTVTATVPAGKRGMQLLTLTNGGGQDSKPFLRK